MFPYPEIRNSTSTSERPVRRVSRLARARLNRKQRAELAAALADGALEISVSPTAKQAAMLVAVPVVEVTRVRRNGKPKRSAPRITETLAEHIMRSSPAERIEAARAVGVDVVWDSMISPVIAAERTAAE